MENNESNRKGIKNLKPFEKGVSGNPNGMPKGIEHSKTRLKRILTLLKEVPNPETKQLEKYSYLELMDLKQVKKALKGDTRAYQEILDRFEDKPTQRVEQKNENTNINITPTDIPIPELIESLKKIQGGDIQD